MRAIHNDNPLRLTLDERQMPAPEQTVYLLWMNDTVINVYDDRQSAEDDLHELRAHLGGPWRQSAGRWHQVDGPIARLFVQPRPRLSSRSPIAVDVAAPAASEAL